jgi:hypothetical protein
LKAVVLRVDRRSGPGGLGLGDGCG